MATLQRSLPVARGLSLIVRAQRLPQAPPAAVTTQNPKPMYEKTICCCGTLLRTPALPEGTRRHTEGTMSFGGSIFLIAVGLVLALAVNVSVSGVDLQLVGWILAAVGALGLLVSLMFYRRRRSVVVEPPPVAPDDYSARY